MRFRPVIFSCCISLCLSSASARVSAQSDIPFTGTAAKVSTGTVKGTILADDTHRPVRFALVMLQSKRAPAHAADGTVTLTGRSDADGNFLVADVPTGDYYLMGASQGYIGEKERMEYALQTGADPAVLLAQIPTVRVVANSTTSMGVTLQHGTAISGHVQWEDGSPAGGIAVMALPLTAPASELPAPLNAIDFPLSPSGRATTDDRGTFRVSGLPAGDYLLQGLVQSSSDSRHHGRSPVDSFVLRMFAPGVPRRSEASVIHTVAAQENGDVAIVMNLEGTHTVAGHASPVSGGGDVTSGQLTLVDSTDPSLQFKTEVGAHGDFQLEHVLKGAYTLHLDEAGSGGASAQFRPYTQSLIVGDADLTDLNLQLRPAQ